MGLIRSTTEGTSQVARGFFTALFALVLVLSGLYLYQNKWEEAAQQLPSSTS
ncbi:MAG: hypothetical protein H6558_05465 [Lewinellaceae bacterium]|nr:hypothetical protein [Lewinellaceae bacterium]